MSEFNPTKGRSRLVLIYSVKTGLAHLVEDIPSKQGRKSNFTLVSGVDISLIKTSLKRMDSPVEFNKDDIIKLKERKSEAIFGTLCRSISSIEKALCKEAQSYSLHTNKRKNPTIKTITDQLPRYLYAIYTDENNRTKSKIYYKGNEIQDTSMNPSDFDLIKLD
jgi:hypothetical protein